MNIDDLENKFESLIKLISNGHTQILEGRACHIQTLEANANTLCEHVKTLPAEQARRMLPHMARAVSLLEELENTLTAHKDEQIDAHRSKP